MMKRKLSIIVLASLLSISTLSAQELAMSATFAYESEYVFRGVQFADESFQPAVDISYGDFYAGIWANEPIVDGVGFNNEIDFYTGYGFGLTDWLSADVGFTYYWFPEDPASESYSREFYAGFAADVTFAPSVYFYYDVDLNGFTIQGSAGHSIPLSDTMENSTLDFGVYIAAVFFDTGSGADYAYYGASLDWSYAFNENAAFSIGMRVSATSLDDTRDANCWWGATFSAGF